jgi:adenine-specific DNA methylase
LASLNSADTDPETFIRQLGIEKVQALVNGQPWTLTGGLLGLVRSDDDGEGFLPVDDRVLRSLQAEENRRAENRELILKLQAEDLGLANDPVVIRWISESQPLPRPWPEEGVNLSVQRVEGDPAWAKERIAWEASRRLRTSEDKYGYSRAYANSDWQTKPTGLIVLDPTAGGGSIPFEALRLGHTVIANELNPVATVILYATLDYPMRFGVELAEEIQHWAGCLRQEMVDELDELFPASRIPRDQENELRRKLSRCAELIPDYLDETLDGYIFVRQVTCPHCKGEAPLMNTCWLCKEAKDPWGVHIVTDGKARSGKVSFRTYRVTKGKGPNGEDPNVSTVNRGIGQCVHCKQAISGDEIKAQARGESPHGQWVDRLYAVVAVRLEPKLDKRGKPQRYKSGLRKGEIKTQKIRFFRPPNRRDLRALEESEKRLKEKWPEWETDGLIPTEAIPKGNDMRPIYYGMPRWCDLFTPRQLLGHVTLVEGLNRLKPEMIEALGRDKARAVVTYLQFAIDKGVDYNSRQTRWHYGRGVLIGTYGRHDLSLKWTFGEMIFTGPNSGAAWGLSQIVDAYQGIAELVEPLHKRYRHRKTLPLTVLHGTAAHMPSIMDKSVDLVCMDPPYYDNVQYGELSDYFYVWQKRTLGDLYPSVFTRRLVNKKDEAVANPVRDGSAKAAKAQYERMMKEIFAECRRVLKDDGLMTLMFTHKTQAAWEALTRSLIESGWAITSSFPVESEAAESLHQKEMAAAASSIFLSCRKRETDHDFPAVWTGLGGQGVQLQIRTAVEKGLEEFAPLRLKPVDEMVACYGRALHVLSEQWPVMDGDEHVSPVKAMLEASRVVAENQIKRITSGRLVVEDLDSETAMALILYGIWGLNQLAYDEALTLSRSLNIALTSKAMGYRLEGRMIGINQNAGGRRGRSRGASAEDSGYHAPLVRKGSKLRLAAPEERNAKRLERPQTDWDILHGMIESYRKGDIPVARAYLEEHANENTHRILDLLNVWAQEMADPDLRREMETLRFGLGSSGN